MNRLFRARLSGKKNSQVMVLLVFALVVLILFLGLAVDLGFAYMTKANLSKAVDSAVLIGALNLGQGQAVATSLATNMFYENYRISARDSTTPVVNVTFTTDAQGTSYINVSATAKPRTFFIGILPQWKTLTVATIAQGTRSRAIICLVLDRSGSMNDNGGAAAMPSAVTNFTSCFDDNRDSVAMVTFATTPAVDVTMPANPAPFKTAIRTKVLSIFPSLVNGRTFSQGGLTNALVQIGVANVDLGENVLKAVVFFTDGKANMIQDTLCSPSMLLNFGGHDPGENQVSFYNPTLPETDQLNEYCHINDGDKLKQSTCPALINACKNVSQFYSQASHAFQSFTRANVTADAEYRAIQVANDMRSSTNKIIVYSIGLGTSIDQTFLKQIANDPSAPGYVPTSYDGKALIAPTSSQLSATFQAIAREISLRLTK